MKKSKSWTAHLSSLLLPLDAEVACALKKIPLLVAIIKEDRELSTRLRIYRVFYEYYTGSKRATGNVRFSLSFWFEKRFPASRRVTINALDLCSRKDFEITNIVDFSSTVFGRYNDGKQLTPDDKEELISDPILAFNINVCVEDQPIEIGGIDLDVVRYTEVLTTQGINTPCSLCDSTYYGRELNLPCKRKIFDHHIHRRRHFNILKDQGDLGYMIEQSSWLSLHGYTSMVAIELSPTREDYGPPEDESELATMHQMIGFGNNLYNYPVLVMDHNIAYMELIISLLYSIIQESEPGDILLVYTLAHGMSSSSLDDGWQQTPYGAFMMRWYGKLFSLAEPGVECVLINTSCFTGGTIFGGQPSGGYICDWSYYPPREQDWRDFVESYIRSKEKLGQLSASRVEALDSEDSEDSRYMTEKYDTFLIRNLKEFKYPNPEDGLVFEVPNFKNVGCPINASHTGVVPPSPELTGQVYSLLREPMGDNDFIVQLSSSPYTDVSYFQFYQPDPWVFGLVNNWVAAELEYNRYRSMYPDSQWRDADSELVPNKQIRPKFVYSGRPKSYLSAEHYDMYLSPNVASSYNITTYIKSSGTDPNSPKQDPDTGFKTYWEVVCDAYGVRPYTIKAMWSILKHCPFYMFMNGFSWYDWYRSSVQTDRDCGFKYDDKPPGDRGNHPSLAWGKWIEVNEDALSKDVLKDKIEEYNKQNQEDVDEPEEPTEPTEPEDQSTSGGQS